MLNISRPFVLLSGAVVLAFGGESKPKTKVESTTPVLWQAPADSRRDLFYGAGGEEDQPRGTVTFENEDRAGSNPKFIVRDSNGVKWTVKMGNEARPETVASRLVWAAGYFTNEDYFVPDLRVEGMPSHLKRGQDLVTPEGVKNVRLKRHNPDEKKDGTWSWRNSPFRGTREWNGLRVLMALMNNWDLKDENNAIYVDKKSDSQIYMVSDLGASFGATALIVPKHRSKDDLDEYRRSKFIRKETAEYVNFAVPGRPSILYLFAEPMFLSRMRLEWIGRHIPRDDARWIGNILGGLSGAQIRDAFRAGGYSASEAEAFATILESRIAQLREL
jgi:hypothetical protein